jgi:hypothetical protein
VAAATVELANTLPVLANIDHLLEKKKKLR